jgi:hypothetical protein
MDDLRLDEADLDIERPAPDDLVEPVNDDDTPGAVEDPE